MRELQSVDEDILTILDELTDAIDLLQLLNLLEERVRIIEGVPDKRPFGYYVKKMKLKKRDERKLRDLRVSIAHPQAKDKPLVIGEHQEWIEEIVRQILSKGVQRYRQEKALEKKVKRKLDHLGSDYGFAVKPRYSETEKTKNRTPDISIRKSGVIIPVDVMSKDIQTFNRRDLTGLLDMMKRVSTNYGMLVQRGEEYWTMTIDNQNILVIGFECDFQNVGQWILDTIPPSPRFDWTNEQLPIAKDLALYAIALLERIVNGEDVNLTKELQRYGFENHGIQLSKSIITGMRRVGLNSQGVFSKMGLDLRKKKWTAKPRKEALDELEKLRSKLQALVSLPFQAFNDIEYIISNASKHIKIVDPYPDEASLRIVDVVAPDVPIMFLSQKIGDAKRVKRFLEYASRMKKHHRKIEIRFLDGKRLHLRLILTSKGAWSMSSSLSRVGHSLESVIQFPENQRIAAKNTFDELWNGAREILID